MSTLPNTAKASHLRLVTGDGNEPFELPQEAAGGFLRSVLDSSPDCIKIIDLDGTLNFMNPNGCRAMEIDHFHSVKGRKWRDLWPQSAVQKVEESIEAALRGKNTRFESFCPTAKGSPRWWEVSVAPVHGEDGVPTAIVSISRDVTERVHQENRIRLHELELQNLALEQAETLREKEQDLVAKDVLLREVDHRMKNSLGMITALLRSDSRSIENEAAREKITAAAGRIASIATVHEHLFMGSNDIDEDAGRQLDMPAYLAALCRDISATLDDRQIDLQVDSDPVTLDSGQAVTMGLLVSELIMNAVRHGAKRSENCIIQIALKKLPHGRELTVSDDGCGLPDDFTMETSNGLGMKVLAMSAQRLDGKLTFGNLEKGSFFKLTF